MSKRSDWLLAQAQGILAKYLQPDSGQTAEEAIDALLGVLDSPRLVPPLSLDQVLDALYKSEINFSVSCFWDNGIDVKLGDTMNGYHAEGNVKTAAEAAAWLDEAARRIYPTSKYVKKPELN